MLLHLPRSTSKLVLYWCLRAVLTELFTPENLTHGDLATPSYEALAVKSRAIAELSLNPPGSMLYRPFYP